MFFLLFGFWVLLNGSWTLEIALIGLVVSAALYAFIVKFMGYSPKKEWAIVRRLPRIIGYFLYLVKEVFLSAWATIKLVWSPKLVVEPEITSFHTHVRTLPGKVVLANSITMTPGTITVDMHDDLFLIHCLDTSFDVGKEGFEMERRVMAVEGTQKAKKSKKGAKKSMTDAYAFLYNGTLIVIGVLLLFCLIRAIRGPRIADRVISINMMGTLIVITICVLAFLMNEGYLVDIAMIYTMLSFLAVVLLTKIYMGVYREKRRRREAAENQAKENEAHE